MAAKGQLRFERVGSITFGELRKESSCVKAQVEATLAMRDGSPENDLVLDRYEITPPGATKPSHEMWVYMEEHGVVFELGKESPTPIHCVQRHFWSTDEDDAEAVALAELLNDVKFAR